MTKTWLVTITTPRRDKFYCNTLRDFFFFWRGPAAGQNHLQKKKILTGTFASSTNQNQNTGAQNPLSCAQLPTCGKVVIEKS